MEVRMSNDIENAFGFEDLRCFKALIHCQVLSHNSSRNLLLLWQQPRFDVTVGQCPVSDGNSAC